MYAFNRRFAPTTFKGLTMITLCLGMLSVILLVFSVGAWFQTQNPVIAAILLVASILSLIFSIIQQKKVKKARVAFSKFVGNFDKKKKTLEIR